jgi:SAM-dependent methyltransferase
MEIHPDYGPSVPEKGWVPAPRYLLRRDRILKLLANEQPGRILEIGCGAGALLFELQSQGWQADAIETSPSAVQLARFIHADTAVSVHDSIPKAWSRQFDILLAMEVLEHIEKDRDALVNWKGLLKPGGHIIISVPAHKKRWNNTDVWAGHFRRYERDELFTLFKEVGFKIERIENYGFPLGNLLEPLRSFHHGRLLRKQLNQSPDNEAIGCDKRTEASGVSRTLETRLYPLYTNRLSRLVFRAAYWIQDHFTQTERGPGFIVWARRP